MKFVKKQRSAQEEEEPWPEIIELEMMPDCVDEYHTWRWKM